MSYELTSASALLSDPCRYPGSKLLVRGPERDLGTDYVAFVGGTEVYGRFIRRPFVAAVEEALDTDCVNLGCTNGGLDSFLRDPGTLAIAARADLTVMQVLGAQNLCNRYYRVHPRRNDRFLSATPDLMGLYPEVDFTEFHFNRHLLQVLQEVSADRFEQVREALQEAWVEGMSRMVDRLEGRVALLWLRYDLDADQVRDDVFRHEPLMVDRAMVDALIPRVKGVIELPVQTSGQCGDTEGMLFSPLEFPTAKLMLGPAEHARIAQTVALEIRRMTGWDWASL